MNDLAIIIIALPIVIVSLAVFWYWLKTIKVMWSYNAIMAVLGIFFSPLIQIAFYFFPKDNFASYEKKDFKKYFLFTSIYLLIAIVVAILIPSIGDRFEDNEDNDNYSVDQGNPWEWDIRVDNSNAELTAASLQETDVAKDDDNAESKHYDAIFQAHPDADKIVDSPEYALWIQGQTDEERNNIARVLNEGTATEIIYVFNRFKQDLATYRANDYQQRRENAQALAQRQYQEKYNRDLEANKSMYQRAYNQQVEQQLSIQRKQQAEADAANFAARQASLQADYINRKERERKEQEREIIKSSIKPYEGMNGKLTVKQLELLAKLNED